MQNDNESPPAPPALPLADPPPVDRPPSAAERLVRLEAAYRHLRLAFLSLCALCLSLLAAMHLFALSVGREHARFMALLRRSELAQAALVMAGETQRGTIRCQAETLDRQERQIAVCACHAQTEIRLAECLGRDGALSDSTRLRACVIGWASDRSCDPPASPTP